MTLYTINQKFRAAPTGRGALPPGDRVLRVAEMFGIGLDESYEVALYENLQIDIRPGDVVFITGPSGSGKSVLLRLIEAAMRRDPAARVVNLGDGASGAGASDPSRDLPDRQARRKLAVASACSEDSQTGERARELTHAARGVPVIELMHGPLNESLQLLSAAGLADAFLLLRTPDELSDGQRYRLRLAMALEQCGLSGESAPSRERKLAGAPGTPHFAVLVADEFCSTLDRLCARAVAYRVRRLANRHGLTVLAAAANDDLAEDLAPDILITKHEGSRVEVRYADPARQPTDGRTAARCHSERSEESIRGPAQKRDSSLRSE
jgi:uncharacterized protein